MVGVCPRGIPEKLGKAMFSYLKRKEMSCTSGFWDFKPRVERDLICIDEVFNVFEFEIKSSLTDLSMEFCKEVKLNKLITGKDYVNYFSYLVPIEIYKVALDKTPVVFGVYACNAQGTSITCKRKPSRLHDREASKELMQEILIQAGTRYWNKK